MPPPELPWEIWRLVHAGMATLREIDEHYTLADVEDANFALDVQEHADYLAHKNAEQAR